MPDDGNRDGDSAPDPERKEVAYEAPEMEVIEGDDRATTGAWVTGFPGR